MNADYQGYFVSESDFDPADWSEYYVYSCYGGYVIWSYEPLPCEVEGMVLVGSL